MVNFNPLRRVLFGALVGCQVVVSVSMPSNSAHAFDDIVIRAEADLDAAGLFGVDESVRAGFSEVRLDIKLTEPSRTNATTSCARPSMPIARARYLPESDPGQDNRFPRLSTDTP